MWAGEKHDLCLCFRALGCRRQGVGSRPQQHVCTPGTMTVAFEHIMTWPGGMDTDADYPYRDANCVR